MTQTKQEPLFDDGGHICGVVAHGDVDNSTMRDLYHSYTDETTSDIECRRGYYRWVPTPNETYSKGLFPSEKGRGAFYGTVFDARDPKQAQIGQ